jgi:hypothetical protein
MEVQPGEGDEYAAPSMNEGARPPDSANANAMKATGGGGAGATGANTTMSGGGGQKTSWLGFTPRGEGVTVRARKSRGKKIKGLDGTF